MDLLFSRQEVFLQVSDFSVSNHLYVYIRLNSLILPYGLRPQVKGAIRQMARSGQTASGGDCTMREISKVKQESRLHSLIKLIGSKPSSRGPPKLVVLCGPSHSGKTMFARRLRRRFRIVSSDDIRKEISCYFGCPEKEAKVWKVFDAMKRQVLKEGDNIVLDACHMSKRARWHALQGTNGQHSKICVVFDLPLRAIRKRCLKEKRLSLNEAERMWRAFKDSKPTVKELKHLGFDKVYFVKQ